MKKAVNAAIKNRLKRNKARINTSIERNRQTLEKLQTRLEETEQLEGLFDSIYEKGEKRDEEDLSRTEIALLDILRTLELNAKSKLEAAKKDKRNRRERIRKATIFDDGQNSDSESEYKP
jgi:hypothetical protein